MLACLGSIKGPTLRATAENYNKGVLSCQAGHLQADVRHRARLTGRRVKEARLRMARGEDMADELDELGIVLER